ncbi:hypothetical protein [Azovibrio restrictus]|uniref:hypothetical protein n=1 Tax=Azovibrio restrictus TaxID=146938 RepID=UPI0026E9D754|nr:hypothetical protein [Azovibrio restrictus]MDD3481748.1 hypothetical protein [Azovibrio restrictus]
MAIVSVQIVRFVDDYQPGIVECQLVDAEGGHFFIDKVPIVAAEDLCLDSSYPADGAIACEIERSGLTTKAVSVSWQLCCRP